MLGFAAYLIIAGFATYLIIAYIYEYIVPRKGKEIKGEYDECLCQPDYQMRSRSNLFDR